MNRHYTTNAISRLVYQSSATLSLDMTYKFRLRLRYERAAAGAARGQLTTKVCETGRFLASSLISAIKLTFSLHPSTCLSIDLSKSIFPTIHAACGRRTFVAGRALYEPSPSRR